jgi:rare lipoprotein A
MVSARLSQILALGALCSLLAACSSGPEISSPVFYTDGKTLAPKKATSRPYQIKGAWYYPQPYYEYDDIGIASYYGGGDGFHGRPTATGERFDKNGLTGAHKTLPLPCMVVITNLENGREIQIKVNDRGPFIEGRFFDASRRVAQLLGFEGKGTAKVRVRTLVPESLALNGLGSSDVMLAQATAPLPEVIPLPVAAPVVTAALPPLQDTAFKAEEAAPVLVASASPSIPLPTKPAAASSTGIFVHVGGYESHQKAQALSESLDGFTDTPVNPVKNKGPNPYAVRLGPLLSMAHANQVLDQLANAGHLMSRIVIQR